MKKMSKKILSFKHEKNSKIRNKKCKLENLWK